MTMDKNLELIKRIKNGDEKSFEILLENHKRMIYKIIYTANINYGDYQIDIESLYQEGCITLYKSVFSFEEEKGMMFTSYAYMTIRARINTYIRDSKCLGDEVYSIDNFENQDYHLSMTSMCVSENPVEYHRELEFQKSLDKFISNLDEEDQLIFKMRADNISYKEISERLKINHKHIDNRLSALRKRLRRYLNGEY